jgi:16S rRNA (uracil1498-N3)-methyltransferase
MPSYLYKLITVMSFILSSKFSTALTRDVTKLSRVFVKEALHLNMDYQICEKDCHYITNVMRLKVGSSFRVFNGRDGEFVCDIESIAKNKKSATAVISKKIKEQSEDRQLPIVLYCAPLKKPRMKLLLEKVIKNYSCEISPLPNSLFDDYLPQP